MSKLVRYFLLLSLIGLSVPSAFVSAEAGVDTNPLPNYHFEASVGEAGLGRPLALNAFDGKIEVGLPAWQLAAPTTVKLTQLNESILPPAGLKAAGPMYQIDVPAAVFKPGRYYISLKSSGSDHYKHVYFFDKNHPGGWRPLPTNENFGKGVISTWATMPFVRLAVFENEEMPIKGRASWYRYKNGMFAASPDFPMGTRLRVINLDTMRFVDVVVNDHGPNRAVHPDRVVDLDAVAFARIAPLGQGTVRVAVERLPDAAPPSVAAVDPSGTPVVSAKAALVFNSADKKVMWSKDENVVRPLASLTKLVAVKVFLETRPDLDRVVAYSVKDEELNSLYVPLSQSARLRLQDGDLLPLKDFVYSSLIGSTNNTVETLVRASGLPRAQFISRMNQRVRDWGATRTSFVEPTGLSPQNVTTAIDYAIIAREVLLDPLIAPASVLPAYSLTTINTQRFHSFKNTNLLAREANSGLLGSKTGYLDEAGHCLITKWPTAKNKNVIIIVLGEPTRDQSIADTKNLVNYANRMIN